MLIIVHGKVLYIQEVQFSSYNHHINMDRTFSTYSIIPRRIFFVTEAPLGITLLINLSLKHRSI